ncbi:MAG: SpoVR family protein [Betaproteobacteria bacterium]|nr:SpoVR family protein [Betaproteobacteria bacterium]
MTHALAGDVARMETLAREQGLDLYPVDFEFAPASFMLEISVYGLPVRMPHWSFGVRYIHQLIRQHMGHSKVFEVMFPGNPCHAYLVESNSPAENTLVIAHVFGHVDFAKNNQLFSRFHEMTGGNIVQHAAQNAHRIEAARREHGTARVEAVLDAALALEPHIDTEQALHRPRYPIRSPEPAAEQNEGEFRRRFQDLPGGIAATPAPMQPVRAPIPPHLEQDLLWFIAQYGEELEDWERDIFLAVREESFYFFPVFACQIMNEGWASYWHARLLREADFVSQELYLSAIKAHSDVVSPFATGEQTSLAINPYHLGFSMWEHIIERRGIAAARDIRREDDDFGFIRNYLDHDLAEKLGLFVYEAKDDGEIRVAARDLNQVREAILAPKFNYGSPRIAVSEVGPDGSLTLVHEHHSDGRGLDLERAQKVVDYVGRVWRRPVRLQTVDANDREVEIRGGTGP